MLKEIVFNKTPFFIFLLLFNIEVSSQEKVKDSLFIIIENSNLTSDTLFGYDRVFHSRTIRYGTFEKYWKDNFILKDSIDYSQPWKEYLFIFPWDTDKWQSEMTSYMNDLDNCNKTFDQKEKKLNCYMEKTYFGMIYEKPIILHRNINQRPFYVKN